jgi:citrate synthase
VTERAAVATRGLQDIVVGTTAISMVDPAGALVYRGYDIDDLAARASYEEVAYLLLMGELPNRDALARFSESMAKERALSPFLLRLVDDMKQATPMDAMRTVISASALEDPDEGDNSHAANMRKSVRLVAKMPTIVAAYMRRRRGQDVIAPDPRKGHAENFAWMALGERPDPLALLGGLVAVVGVAQVRGGTRRLAGDDPTGRWRPWAHRRATTHS